MYEKHESASKSVHFNKYLSLKERLSEKNVCIYLFVVLNPNQDILIKVCPTMGVNCDPKRLIRIKWVTLRQYLYIDKYKKLVLI